MWNVSSLFPLSQRSRDQWDYQFISTYKLIMLSLISLFLHLPTLSVFTSFDSALICRFFLPSSWPIPQLEPSQIRLIVYQDCERRGRNVLFDSNAKKRGTEETPITVSHMFVLCMLPFGSPSLVLLMGMKCSRLCCNQRSTDVVDRKSDIDIYCRMWSVQRLSYILFLTLHISSSFCSHR